MQGRELRLKQWLRLLEVGHRLCALALLKFQNRQHAMAREIVGAQTEEMLNYRNSFWIARVVIDLSSSLQSRNIVGKCFQCPAKGSERLFSLPFTGIGHTLHGPQLAFTGKFLERYLKEVECSVKLLGTQCGGDRRH